MDIEVVFFFASADIRVQGPVLYQALADTFIKLLIVSDLESITHQNTHPSVRTICPCMPKSGQTFPDFDQTLIS